MTDETTAAADPKTATVRKTDVERMKETALKLAKNVGKANLAEEAVAELRNIAEILFSTASHAETLLDHAVTTVASEV